jgi:hypothetical protein
LNVYVVGRMISRHSDRNEDFEASIRIFSKAEGGRNTSVTNGIRWDFAYADDPSATLYMIWPDFLDTEGCSRVDDLPLPVNTRLTARMYVIVDEMREAVHRSRITPGVRFFCHEGSRRVAEGTVTRVTGLFELVP